MSTSNEGFRWIKGKPYDGNEGVHPFTFMLKWHPERARILSGQDKMKAITMRDRIMLRGVRGVLFDFLLFTLLKPQLVWTPDRIAFGELDRWHSARSLIEDYEDSRHTLRDPPIPCDCEDESTGAAEYMIEAGWADAEDFDQVLCLQSGGISRNKRVKRSERRSYDHHIVIMEDERGGQRVCDSNERKDPETVEDLKYHPFVMNNLSDYGDQWFYVDIQNITTGVVIESPFTKPRDDNGKRRDWEDFL
jgi:hypothetical protein